MSFAAGVVVGIWIGTFVTTIILVDRTSKGTLR